MVLPGCILRCGWWPQARCHNAPVEAGNGSATAASASAGSPVRCSADSTVAGSVPAAGLNWAWLALASSREKKARAGRRMAGLCRQPRAWSADNGGHGISARTQ